MYETEGANPPVNTWGHAEKNNSFDIQQPAKVMARKPQSYESLSGAHAEVSNRKFYFGCP